MDANKNNNNQKGTDMKTFLVKFTGSNEWIEMQATSKFELAERLRQEGKSGSIKSPQNMEETMNTTPAKMTALVKLEKLSPEEVAEITALLEKNILPHLTSDVSNYAKGRQRVWLPYAAPLGNMPFTPELMDDEVWQWIVDRCAKHGFKAQVALISKGGNIHPHGDTTYAAPWAMGFNLGKCDWHIQNNRDAKRTPKNAPEEALKLYYESPTTSHLSLTGGEVFKFNCKHEHAVTNAAPDRWSINVWAIADGPAADRANIARRLEQMLEKHPEVQEFIELHKPGATTNKSKEDTTMATKPKYHIAFTGHRPHKLGGYDPTNPKRVAVRAAIHDALQRAINKYGETHEIVAITGGALGVDQDAASIAHKLGLPFIVAVPCQGQDSKWPAESKVRYAKMLSLASEVVMVHDGPYNNTCMDKRNEWMVDHCDALVAVWDGTSGGTANCVKYAKKMKKPIVFINPNDNNGGGGGTPKPTPNNPEEGPKMKAEEPQNTNPVTETDDGKEKVMNTTPVVPQTPTKVDKTTNNKPKEGNNMIKEYLVSTVLLKKTDDKMAKEAVEAGLVYSTSRVITNDPEYWFKQDHTIVIEEVNRGGYHYALLEHMFGNKSFIVNITSYKDPLDPFKELQIALMVKNGKTPPTDSIFGWADFDAETIIRVKGHGNKGWTDLSEFGLSVKNSEKMTKRLVEIVRAARGYKINIKANGDRMLKILVLSHNQILKAFPHLENEFIAEKTFDGVSVMAVEKAKDVYRNNVHMSKRSIAKMLNQIDNLEITNHTLRVLTNINGVAGEIKGNVLTGKRAAINARLVELGLSDGKVSYDIVTSVDNFKKELGTDGTWEIITLEPHHGPGMVKTNDQTLGQFAGIKGIFDFKEILDAFKTVLDDIKQNIKDGKDVEWATLLRAERAVTEADKFNQARLNNHKGLNKMYATLNELDLPLGVSQTLMFMRAYSIKKMFLADYHDKNNVKQPNWKAPARMKKSFLYMPWAYRAYAMTKEVIFLAGYDIDMQNTNCGYHKETQTFAMPGKQWAQTCGKLGGADLDDEIMIHIRKFVELNGSERLAALLIRTPNDWAEFDIVNVRVPGPVFVNKLDMPTVHMKDLAKFNKTSVNGQLPSKINGSNRPRPAVWDWASTVYNHKVSMEISGGVGGQVKTKMLRYAIYNSPFPTLPCANEDMIDAIQQCKGDVADMMVLSDWSANETEAILRGKAMDAYWWHSRNMRKTAKALGVEAFTWPMRAENSPIVTKLMVPREKMVEAAFKEIFEFLKKEITPIEEISDVFTSKDQEMRFRKIISDVKRSFDIPQFSSKMERTQILNKAATHIMELVQKYEEKHGEEATNMHILRMARASFLVKVDRTGANYDKWLYTVTPNSDVLMTDYLFRAIMWYRNKKA